MRRNAPHLVLASGSATRRAMLEAAGIAVTVTPADVDEAAIRDGLLADTPGLPHARIALALAEEKAKAVSAQHKHALVIGADQVLSFEGRLFEKPRDMDDARASLVALRGKTHTLHSAVALGVNGETVWHDVAVAHLTMRAFSNNALDGYLARVGDVVLTSVGAYQIEGPAVQLFAAVEGDHATILGMPLLPLVAELLRRGVLEA
ncbi:septum formation protein Maf [Hyphomicrobium nitrativorans NL23]|uniref:Nucleoside triphosphate pyrophosphatase n=1 Tax=Hyphomicrobium nitrativorans NL23 TaxID=1029756 RepID=V5S9X5_9HYPH|nr:Maf family protein [Hyphomicrobium nitrativorans]AHB47428.1 septum formation protein Maf [Hyphomicrobium nitrativorans NL23]